VASIGGRISAGPGTVRPPARTTPRSRRRRGA